MHLRTVALAGTLLVGAATQALASDPRSLQVDDLFQLKDVGDPRVSQKRDIQISPWGL